MDHCKFGISYYLYISYILIDNSNINSFELNNGHHCKDGKKQENQDINCMQDYMIDIGQKYHLRIDHLDIDQGLIQYYFN